MADEAETIEKTDTAEPAKTDAERKEALSVLEQALKRADWGYKMKAGKERELGHQTMILAEKAFIGASIHDEKEASRLYEKAAGRPPKAELMERAAAAREQEHKISIADLSAGIAKIGKQRDAHVMKAEASDIEKKMGGWKSALLDAHDKGIQHRKNGHDEMLADPKHRDDGLHIFSALRSGMKASHSYRQMVIERKKKKELHTVVIDHHKQHRGILATLTHFDREDGVEGLTAATKGPTGTMVGRFQGAFTKAAGIIVKAVERQTNPEAAKTMGPERGASAAARAAMGQGIER